MTSKSPILLAAIAVLVGLPVGCARPAGEIFPEIRPPVVWPPPPDTPRIRYLGQLATDTDLRPAKSGWQVFAESLGGPKAQRSVSTPAGLAIAPDGRVFAADPSLHAVHVFDLDSRRYRSISEAGDQLLFTPACVAIGDGSLFVTDSGLQAVMVYDAGGRFVRSFGADGLQRPVGIAYLGTFANENSGLSTQGSGLLFVVDAAAHACIIFDTAGREIRRFGRRGSGPAEFNYPTHITVHARHGVFITDSLNFRVQRFKPDGTYVSTIGSQGDGAGYFALPKGVAVDDPGRVYVVDAQFENVQVFSPDGELLLAFGREGRGPGEFWLPNGIAIDARQRLWVADAYNRRIQVFQIIQEEAAP